MSYYYAVDGDDIGKALEKHILLDDIYSIQILSQKVNNSLKVIELYLHGKGAETIFCAGDSLLSYSKTYIDFPSELLINENLSFSVGIGMTLPLSLLALKKAKGLGKKRVEKFMREPK